jgi:hypothetical protein
MLAKRLSINFVSASFRFVPKLQLGNDKLKDSASCATLNCSSGWDSFPWLKKAGASPTALPSWSFAASLHEFTAS